MIRAEILHWLLDVVLEALEEMLITQAASRPFHASTMNFMLTKNIL